MESTVGTRDATVFREIRDFIPFHVFLILFQFFLFCLTYYKKQTHKWDKNFYWLYRRQEITKLNKNVLFSFQMNPLPWSVSYVISKKKVKIDIFKILSHMVALHS